MMTSLSLYLPWFATGAVFGLVLGATAGISYLVGMRVAHQRYRALKIADRGKYIDSIHDCREQNRRFFEAECKSYRKVDLSDGPGGLTTAQFGKN